MTLSWNDEVIQELRKEWEKLWRERIDDRVRAEAIAAVGFSKLFIEKGTIIFATRDFRLLSFKEILEVHGFSNVHRLIPPDPVSGGWGRFIRTAIGKQKPSSRARQAREQLAASKRKQQLKKGGRGWLHKL